jgi:hypothetical protein
MTRRIAVLFVGLAISASATSFQQIALDASAEALGSTATGIEARPGSALANPALLPLLPQAGAHFLYHDWYGSGVQSKLAAWTQPWKSVGLSISWHRYGLDNLWTEDEVAIGLGSRFTALKREFSAGFRLRGLMVATPAYEGADGGKDPRGYALDLAFMIPLRERLNLSFLQKSLLRSELEFLEGGEVWPAAPREGRLGLNYIWRSDLALILEYRSEPGQDGQLLFGAEVRFFNAFHVRAGSGGDFATAGFGLRSARWQMDFAFQSRGRLGNNMSLSFSPLLAKKEARR